MNHIIDKRIAIFGCVLIVLVTACNGTSLSTLTPEGAVESYLTALIAKNSNSLSTLSCGDWEPNALMELDSFQAVDVRLDGLSCAEVGMDGDFTLVKCQGKIVATYNGEDEDIELSTRNYQVLKQNGEYLVCGYQ